MDKESSIHLLIVDNGNFNSLRTVKQIEKLEFTALYTVYGSEILVVLHLKKHSHLIIWNKKC